MGDTRRNFRVVAVDGYDKNILYKCMKISKTKLNVIKINKYNIIKTKFAILIMGNFTSLCMFIYVYIYVEARQRSVLASSLG